MPTPVTQPIDQDFLKFKVGQESINDYNLRTKAYLAQRNPTEIGAPAPTTTIQPTAPTMPVPPEKTPEQNTLDTANEGQNKLQADFETYAKPIVDKIVGLENGSIGLTPEEQAQVNGLKQKFQGWIDDQKLVNAGATGGAATRAYAKGAGENALFTSNMLGSVISAGNAKVQDLEIKMADSVAQMTQAFKTDDIAMAKSAYDSLETFREERANAFQKTIDETNKIIQQQKEAQVAEQERIYEEVVKPIQSISLTAAKFGAPPALLEKINNAGSVEEAIQIASSSLVDPKAQYELEGAQLDLAYKKAQIAKLNKETSQIGQPTAAQVKASAAEAQASEEAVAPLQDKLALIEKLLVSPGLASAVGPNIGPDIPYVPDLHQIARFGLFSAGKRQNFIAGVSQLVNQETIDTLIKLKARGGTLGALSDQERILLQSAATKIGQWQVEDDKGRVLGYNINEQAFKDELNTIKTVTQRALEKARGGLISPEEQDGLDMYFGNTDEEQNTFDAANFY